MPLIQGNSDKAFSKNVSAERNSGKPMKQSLAIAYAVKRKNQKAKGGLIKDQDIGIEPMDAEAHDASYEPMIEDEMPAEPMEKAMPPRVSSLMMSKGGIAQRIMAKKMAAGGMVNQGDNMPVNDDSDNFSAETSSEGPLDEGMFEEDREDKIMGRKRMLGSIMARLHSDNKGY